MFRTSNQKEIDVRVQDQTTGPFHRYFMTEDKTDITLTATVSKDTVEIPVSSGHGFTAGGEYMLINYGNYIQQTKVKSVATDTITIESPVGIELPDTTGAVQIIRGRIEMNVDGSSTPVTYYCRIGANSDPVDIQHLHVFMGDATVGTDALYGGGAELTNGCFVRIENDVDLNLGLYKKNQDYLQFGAKTGDNYTTKVASTDYGMNFPFDIKETFGIVFRLGSNIQFIKFVVQDDLTGLTEHRVVATGQITLGE